MKKLILLAMLTMAFNNMYSQGYGNYASSIGISGGYAEDGVGFMATYNYHLDAWKFFQVSVFASIAEDKGDYDIPYQIFTVQPGFFYMVWEEQYLKKFAINLGGGGVAGYEVINNGDNQLSNGAVINGKSRFIYGGYLGIEGEMRLNNSLSILIKANEYYHVNSDVGNLYPYAGVGIRYFLY